jgi:hypothetical protein
MLAQSHCSGGRLDGDPAAATAPRADDAAVQHQPVRTITDALARRDVLRTRHAVVTDAADAAAGRDGYTRQLRSELKMLAGLPVAQLRGQADALALEIRELDVRIQRSNWEVELLDLRWSR